jgi:hypothetical protein
LESAIAKRGWPHCGASLWQPLMLLRISPWQPGEVRTALRKFPMVWLLQTAERTGAPNTNCL